MEKRGTAAKQKLKRESTSAGCSSKRKRLQNQIMKLCSRKLRCYRNVEQLRLMYVTLKLALARKRVNMEKRRIKRKRALFRMEKKIQNLKEQILKHPSMN